LGDSVAVIAGYIMAGKADFIESQYSRVINRFSVGEERLELSPRYKFERVRGA